ncbi:translation initiation factor IF-2-like [Oenanthe melanoleuca]|uniref:translation initiation factor IF-2-like n=1 Tax=Oenanthe melanoleuca TaxID=2939378 RepID=UPI0024C186AB|nr:translation initiation factor IF-2-like [Oenanthe melanoleuca]
MEETTSPMVGKQAMTTVRECTNEASALSSAPREHERAAGLNFYVRDLHKRGQLIILRPGTQHLYKTPPSHTVTAAPSPGRLQKAPMAHSTKPRLPPPAGRPAQRAAVGSAWRRWHTGPSCPGCPLSQTEQILLGPPDPGGPWGSRARPQLPRPLLRSPSGPTDPPGRRGAVRAALSILCGDGGQRGGGGPGSFPAPLRPAAPHGRPPHGSAQAPPGSSGDPHLPLAERPLAASTSRSARPGVAGSPYLGTGRSLVPPAAGGVTAAGCGCGRLCRIDIKGSDAGGGRGGPGTFAAPGPAPRALHGLLSRTPLPGQPLTGSFPAGPAPRAPHGLLPRTPLPGPLTGSFPAGPATRAPHGLTPPQSLSPGPSRAPSLLVPLLAPLTGSLHPGPATRAPHGLPPRRLRAAPPGSPPGRPHSGVFTPPGRG